MKRNIFIALAAFAICSSCSDSYYLPETERDLAQLNSEYDDVKAKEADDEGEKIETLASEVEIQASMDEYNDLVNRGVFATPTIIVNDRLVYMTNSYEELSRLLEYELR